MNMIDELIEEVDDIRYGAIVEITIPQLGKKQSQKIAFNLYPPDRQPRVHLYQVHITKKLWAFLLLRFERSESLMCTIGLSFMECPDYPDGPDAYETLVRKYGGLIVKRNDKADEIVFGKFSLVDNTPRELAREIISTAIQVDEFLEALEHKLHDERISTPRKRPIQQ
jgi:hypothetical protein